MLEKLLKPRYGIIISLLLILFFQFLTSFDKFNIPFFDSRIHYNRDNALFTKYAYDGNTNGDFKSQFGVTSNSYISSEKKVGESSYYTHHPFFFKMLFQQYTKIVGYNENASRTFYFLENSVILILLFGCVYLLSNNVFLASLSSAFLLSIPLFMTFQTAVKFETDGILGMLLSFFSIILIDKKGLTIVTKIFFVVSSILLLWSHWPSYVFYFLFWGYFLYSFIKNKTPESKTIFTLFTLGGVCSVIIFLGLVIFLKGGWTSFYSDIFAAFIFRTNQDVSNIIPISFYLDRQWIYIGMNYTVTLFTIFLIAFFSVFLFYKRHMKFVGKNRDIFLLFYGMISMFIAASFWQFLFTNGSFIHNYWQYYFNVPLVLFFAYLYQFYSQNLNVRKWINIVVFVLILLLGVNSYFSYNQTVYNQLGTKEDLQLLKNVRNDTFSKFVFIPTVDTPLNSWFQGEIFPYYSLRPVLVYSQSYVFSGDEKVILLRHNEQQEVLKQIQTILYMTLTDEKCSQMYCLYNVKNKIGN